MYEPAIKTNEDIEEVKIVDLEDTLIQQTSKKKKKMNHGRENITTTKVLSKARTTANDFTKMIFLRLW